MASQDSKLKYNLNDLVIFSVIGEVSKSYHTQFKGEHPITPTYEKIELIGTIVEEMPHQKEPGYKIQFQDSLNGVRGIIFVPEERVLRKHG